MPLVFKLVGYTSDKKLLEIYDTFQGSINIKLIHEIFIFWGISEEDLENIKFITDSEELKDSDKDYLVKSDEDRVIFVFTSEPSIRSNLQTIFARKGSSTNHTYLDKSSNSNQMNDSDSDSDNNESNDIDIDSDSEEESINKPLVISDIVIDTIPQLSPEIIDTMNKKSVLLFSDPDFKSLVSIYTRKPELFGVFSKYIQSGTIIEDSKSESSIISEDESIHYNELAEKLSYLELPVSKEILINTLIKFSGHLNLTVRSILQDSCV